MPIPATTFLSGVRATQLFGVSSSINSLNLWENRKAASLVRLLTLTLVNVKLSDEFRLSFFLYALSRVELSIAMLTQSQSDWRQPHDSELAMGHA